MIPQRIQRKRTKGWRMPEGAVYVGRPTKWGNPSRPGWIKVEGRITGYLSERGVVDLYRDRLLAGGLAVSVDDVRRELAGRDLACWCYSWLPCHADVLLELANATEDA